MVLALKNGSSGVDRPLHGGEPVARGPAVDLADVFDDQRVAKFFAQVDAPQSDHRMRLAAGGRDRELRVLRDPRRMQARDQIARQERTIRGGAQHPGDLGPVGRGPVERRQNAGERSRKIRDAVGDDRQPEAGEPRRIAIGVEDRARRIAASAARSRAPEWCGRRSARIGLSPPPIRRARPPASSTPGWRFSRHVRRPCACGARILPRRKRDSGRRRCAPRPTAR